MRAPKRNVPARLLSLAALLAAGETSAHDADVIYVQPRFEGGWVTVRASMSAATLALLAPIDADGDGLFTQADADASAAAIRAGFWAQAPLSGGGESCALGKSRAAARPSEVVLEADFVCAPGELRQDFWVLRVLPKNYSVTWGASAAQARATASVGVTAIAYSLGRASSRPLAPVPVWVWASFLLGPCVLMLFERRQF